MLEVDNGFEDVVESFRPQLQVTTPDIAEWVGDMVGWVWSWVERLSVSGVIQPLEVGDYVFSG